MAQWRCQAGGCVVCPAPSTHCHSRYPITVAVWLLVGWMDVEPHWTVCGVGHSSLAACGCLFASSVAHCCSHRCRVAAVQYSTAQCTDALGSGQWDWSIGGRSSDSCVHTAANPARPRLHANATLTHSLTHCLARLSRHTDTTSHRERTTERQRRHSADSFLIRHARVAPPPLSKTTHTN